MRNGSRDAGAGDVWTAALALVAASIVGVGVASSASPAHGQSVGSGSLRPFVTGFTPVFGRGGRFVGGVVVDARGVVSNATPNAIRQRKGAIEKSLDETPASLRRESHLRLISLRRIDEAIGRYREQQKPLPQEILLLGGMTRLQYVIADRQHKDILLAGHAEPWRTGESGDVVGARSGRPVLRLEDLLVTMRLAADGKVASCSIDPTEEGTRKLQSLLASQPRPSARLKQRLEQSLGPQVVTIEGVAPTTRVAHVMLAADVQMKRLAMHLQEDAPAAPKSYLEMLREAKRQPTNAAPRWWIAADYDAVQHSPDRTVWRLVGDALAVQSEDGYAQQSGRIVNRGAPDPLTAEWSESFNRHLPDLVRRYPVYADLQNLVDLSVVAAIVWDEDMPARVDCPLANLVDNQAVRPAEWPAPKQIDSTASLLPNDRGLIVAVSGGVELDGWRIVDEKAVEVNSLGQRTGAAIDRRPREDTDWTWD